MPKLPDIVGHERQLLELARDIESGNIAHAYLFSGRRHLGKMTVAHRFALQLLLIGLPEEGREQARHDFGKLTHPDLLVLDQLWIEGVQEDWEQIARTSNVPQVHRAKKEKKAKTDSIGIEDIRVLQGRLLETGIGVWRCCVIRSAERMHDEAANAFLKILEEPPPGLVFLLTTQQKSSLLPTIVSRARGIPFHPLSRAAMQPLLADCTEDDRQFIVHLAQGAPGIATLLRRDPDALRTRRLVHARALSFWRTPALGERMQILVPLHKRGQESDDLLLHLALALRGESPDIIRRNAPPLARLADGLRTNAHRQLLAQEFALSVS